jgi:hypothetical protein
MARPRETSDRTHRTSNRATAVSEALEPRRLFNGALSGSFTGAMPAALLPAATNHVKMRLTNTSGGAQAGAVTVSLSVSTTPDLTTDAVIVGIALRVVRMRAGQSIILPFRFASPSSVPDGNDYLVAKIDGPASSAGAPNESVIVAPQSVAVVRPVVNLMAQVSAPFAPLHATQFAGSSGRAQVLISNIGNAPARGPMQITVYASTDGTLDASDPAVGVAAFRSAVIRPGTFHPFPIGLHVAPGTAIGSYTLFASIHSAQTINPAGAANMIIATGARPLMVTVPPVVIDNRSHHHDDAGGGGIGALLGLNAGSYFYGGTYDDGTTDSSGYDDSSTAADTGDSGATTAPTTAPIDSGGSTDDSGGDDNGSDFGGNDFGGSDFGSGDSGGGIDF